MGATPSSIPSIVEASHHPSQTIRGTTTMHRSVAAKLHFNEKEIIKVMYPVYFIEEDATKEEIKRAEESWELILQDKTPEYLERKAKEGENFPYQSCITFFFDLFYTRLFEIHPMCRHLFVSGIKIQGRFLVKMIGLALSVYHDPVKFDEFLGKLALGHYEKGVKAIEYGIVGQVLFWSLRSCLGKAYYTYEMHIIWIKVYSRMLRIVVPIAVSYEVNGPSPNMAQRATRKHSFLFPNEPSPTTDTSEEEQLKSEGLRKGEKVEGEQPVQELPPAGMKFVYGITSGENVPKVQL